MIGSNLEPCLFEPLPDLRWSCSPTVVCLMTTTNEKVKVKNRETFSQKMCLTREVYVSPSRILYAYICRCTHIKRMFNFFPIENVLHFFFLRRICQSVTRMFSCLMYQVKCFASHKNRFLEDFLDDITHGTFAFCNVPKFSQMTEWHCCKWEPKLSEANTIF